MTIDPLVVGAASYVAEVDPVKGFARVKGSDGRPWFKLRLFASLDTTGGPDETVGELTVSHQADGDAVTVTVSAVSTAWRSRVTTTPFRGPRSRPPPPSPAPAGSPTCTCSAAGGHRAASCPADRHYAGRCRRIPTIRSG